MTSIERHRVDMQIDELLDALADVLNQACHAGPRDGEIDSMALSAYTDGLLLLAKYGRFEVRVHCGRRVQGTFLNPEEGEAT